jgi:hypothetical protein
MSISQHDATLLDELEKTEAEFSELQEQLHAKQQGRLALLGAQEELIDLQLIVHAKRARLNLLRQAEASRITFSPTLLAKVEIQLIMRMLDRFSLLQFARCCSGTYQAASDSFAWQSIVQVVWSSSLPLRIQSSLLRAVPRLNVTWYVHRNRELCDPMTLEDPEISSVLMLPHLHTLRVGGKKWAAQAMMVIAHQWRSNLCCTPSLRRIELEWGHDLAATMLSDMLITRHSIESFTMKRSQLKHGMFALARSVAQCATLTELDLSANQCSNEEASAWAAAVRSPHCGLTSLSLIDNVIEPMGISNLARAVAQKDGMRKLDLRGNPGLQSRNPDAADMHAALQALRTIKPNLELLV